MAAVMGSVLSVWQAVKSSVGERQSAKLSDKESIPLGIPGVNHNWYTFLRFAEVATVRGFAHLDCVSLL
jgi:hypothetical protein